MANRLAGESSPYLLQHAGNPVDWYPWGDEALQLSQTAKKPIFLSIGYSACHWCHVMEHESFEDEGLARQLNEAFVCIKVDREERPDLDQIYMQAVQLLTGRGGWPMSVFLTPDLEPFYGGTYWPPAARQGLPGFGDVLTAVRNAWDTQPDAVSSQAQRLTEAIRQAAPLAATSEPLSSRPLDSALAQLDRAFDHRQGGFGGAPKFPHPLDLRLLLRIWRRTGRSEPLEMATRTLDKMAGGGIYDQLGGGFHRYSVDAHWLVPHFEKMLYDNGLLIPCYVEAWQATGRSEYARVVRETCDYVLREMTAEEGGFFSTQDADSEGEEGKFYVWSKQEIDELLGEAASEVFCYVYDVTDGGNFEGHNILNLPKTLAQVASIRGRSVDDLLAELAAARGRLKEVRDQRIWPGLDDKILVSWNGLMIAALAEAAAALQEDRYLQAATRAAEFLHARLVRERGRLWHLYRHGKVRVPAYLDDYAALANGLLSLYEAGFDERWLAWAGELVGILLADFDDPDQPGLFFSSLEHEHLLARQKDLQDSSVPSGNALAAMALVRLARLSGLASYKQAAERLLGGFGPLMEKSPLATGQMLLALDYWLGPVAELALTGEREHIPSALAPLRRSFWPNKLVAWRTAPSGVPILDPLFAGKPASPQPVLYVCEKFACQAPISGAAAIAARLNELAPPATT